MTTQNWNFEQRDNKTPIEYEGGANKICEGCIVDLTHDGTVVTVQVNGNEGNGWTGAVTAFPNSTETTFGDLKIGTTIQFEETHIFRCAA